MSSAQALYFVHTTTLQREKCSWRREYFELSIEGMSFVLASVVEYEDKTFYRTTYPHLWLPAGVVLCTRQAYRNTVARCQMAKRAQLNKARAERAALKLLRGEQPKAKAKPKPKATPTPVAPPVSAPAPLPAPMAAPLIVATVADVLADFTVFDCETTGFSADTDSIIELAAVRLRREGEGWVEVDRMQTFVYYTERIPINVVTLTGISVANTRSAPELARVLQAFHKLAGDSLLVGHNVPFDLRFVNAARAQLGAATPLANSFLCTQVLAKLRLPGRKSYSLVNLCGELNIVTDGAHRAMRDVRMTIALLLHLHQQRPLTPDLLNQTGTAKVKAKPVGTGALFAA